MFTRRSFLIKGSLLFGGAGIAPKAFSNTVFQEVNHLPVVISTWGHGMTANETAWKVLADGGYSLDAVEAGVRVPEADPNVISVGKGGIPDACGKVMLDASIMDEKGNAGSVSNLQHIVHPVSVARLVMEKTPHVMLSGKGALKFALDSGFEKEKLLTKARKKEWKHWKKDKSNNRGPIPANNHDAIGMLAIDREGRISGACSTSGMEYKIPGRVSDSPIIGAGLYVDGKIGGAVATGTEELVMKTLGSCLVVEFMRNGLSPGEACEQAVRRIAQKIPDYQEHQVGYIALNANGEYGAFSIQAGFEFAVKTTDKTELIEAEAWLKKL